MANPSQFYHFHYLLRAQLAFVTTKFGPINYRCNS